MKHLSLLLVPALLLMGCDESTLPQKLEVGSFDAVTQVTMLDLSAAPSFADERGGGVFVDLAGRVVRVRANGERGVLESHPRNTVWPGPALGIYSLGPSNALVATTRGFFVADQGWLIAPSWQASLSAEGLRATTLGSDGAAWLAHDTGLFRLDRGQLSEFKLGETSLTGVTALAAAPSLDGAPGIWFTREGKLFSAAQTARTTFTVREVQLDPNAIAGEVIGLAGLGPNGTSGGELWAITQHALLTYTGSSWRQFTLGASPRRLMGTGRFAWLQAGDALYRFDADGAGWARVAGLDAAANLLGLDATGNAWVRVGETTLSVGPAVPVRLRGLHQGARVYDGQLVLQAALPAAAPPTSLEWHFDDAVPHGLDADAGVMGSGPTDGQLFFSLGGTEAGEVLRPVSFGSLADGWHTLTFTATQGDSKTTRKVNFEFLGSATATVSWENDIKPISVARCAKCHSTGTEPELTTYEQWKANANFAAAAVRDARMPADGPMDSASISTIVRWANGGTLP